jgi:hypothetical protein
LFATLFFGLSVFGLVGAANAQVRVISGDVQHIYGPKGELLDDADMRAENARVEAQRRARQEQRARREYQDRLDEIRTDLARRRAELDQSIATHEENQRRRQSKSGWNLH